MQVGGGLNYVTGPMGAGKTLYGVRRIVQTVCMNRYAVTNIELTPGWEHRVASHFARHRSKANRLKIASRVKSFYVYEESLIDAMKYRLPDGRTEGRGTFMWDETHNDLNNRRWRDEGREAILEWATQLRKLGFVGYLLSQHADNTDAALRRVCNFQVRLQNQKEQTRLMGMKVSPWPLFIAAWYPANLSFVGTKQKPMKIERYFLTWHRHLYDTLGLFHGLATDTESGAVIKLPDGGRAADAPASRPADALLLPGPAWVSDAR